MFRSISEVFAIGKRRFDLPLLFSLFFLFGFGIIVMFSASVIPAEREFADPYYYLNKQLLWGGAGIFLFLVFAQIPYPWLVKFSFPFCLLSVFLLVSVFIPGLGKSVSTSYGRSFNRWIQIGGFQIQPSEFSKISLLLFLSLFFQTFDPKKIKWDRKNLVSVFTILLILFLIIIEPAFGTTVEILVVIFFFVIMAGFPFKRILILAVSILPLLLILVTQVGYRKKRLDIWLDPYKYRFDEGHQLVTSFRAFFDGASFGKPIGSGYSHRYLAYSHTDFVLAAFVEDFGFLGFLIFFFMVLFLLHRTFQLVVKVKDKLGFYLGTGILLLLAIQILINLYVVTGLVPVTGISLPFLSYGGSSLITVFILMGILANITRKENLAL
ncbi:FtsW/RodA/SpoVE family cell cycle protein [Leptospira idonii]|uniref:Probable peptidoglycan glycosyltransferase FtsW n=1 Tax=Leptospira idonii TaxID=1193500 RepID=A0A4R9LWJ5_9LEPT|nr:FtsW/RodA/SpoVE family cell cycle protein [Leptospira idonii]TGN18610.1 cell division protein FtsW [Leptospira idonii]